jgi:hypothetical protein
MSTVHNIFKKMLKFSNISVGVFLWDEFKMYELEWPPTD